jgi:hypothetical protein
VLEVRERLLDRELPNTHRLEELPQLVRIHSPRSIAGLPLPSYSDGLSGTFGYPRGAR